MQLVIFGYSGECGGCDLVQPGPGLFGRFQATGPGAGLREVHRQTQDQASQL